MSNSSNLYAEKVYSEHPTVLWALDDKCDYISFLDETSRNVFSSWSVSNGALSSGSSIVDKPFKDSVASIVKGDVPEVGETTIIELVSSDLLNLQDFDQNLETFSTSAYVFSNSPSLKSILIGYEYTDPDTSTVVQQLKTFTVDYYDSWGFVSETFPIPEVDAEIRLVLKIESYYGGTTVDDYEYFINGVTLGQWSEEFNATSLGVNPSSFTEDISITGINYAVPASAYGLSEDFGYYLIESNKLLAKNTSVPLVFGAAGITKLTPNTNGKPSLIVPGKGFLNNVGKYKEYTAEFWARIDSNTSTQRKIFGPIASDDGLYVESGFLTLNINGNYGSHFVGQWFRPMLINIVITKSSASVLVNGEKVISFIISQENISFPDELNSAGKSQDWLGFYCYEDVPSIEVDCIAIYSYEVSATLAKRRWVYGQGVLSPEGVNSAYGATSSFIDYPFSKYSVNYSYPNMAKWDQGTFDNLVTTSQALTTPTYSLPTIAISGVDVNSWYSDCSEVQDLGNPFITFRPNEAWADRDCYLYFEKFNFLPTNVRSFYGVFQVSDEETNDQVLFYLYNPITKNSLKVVRTGNSISYYITVNNVNSQLSSIDEFIDGGTALTVIFESIIDGGYPASTFSSYVNGGTPSEFIFTDPFVVGFDIDAIIEKYGDQVSQFFGDRKNLKLYVGGTNAGGDTFTGNILSVGLCTDTNFNTVVSSFDNSGIAFIDEFSTFLNHTASYTLIPTSVYDKFTLDIGISGSWEDYMPLSYFGKYTTDQVGNKRYSLNFMQMNIDYPEALTSESGFYNTADSEVRSYITFQYISNGANATQDSFDTLQEMNNSGVLFIDSYPNWETTKFEIVDNSLVYPLKSVDFNNLAIVYRLEFNVRGILRKPVKIKNFEIASQSFNDDSFNSVGTRFGVDMFPYRRSGLYFDHTSHNPFSIYKGSTPYLYLNKNSGIEVRGTQEPSVNRGISIPVNSNLATNYRVSAFQTWLRSGEKTFSTSPVKLLDIEYGPETLDLYIIANDTSGKRGRIYAKSRSSGSIFNGITFYLNGSIVREPVISAEEWYVLGMKFSKSIIFDSIIGSIDLNGPFVFNNIAYYKANDLQQLQSFITRPWLKVKQDGLTEYGWDYWGDSFSWEEVLIIGSNDLYGVNPSDVYKTYIGTNKIIFDDGEGLMVNPEKMNIYSEVLWQTSVKIPV